MQLCKNNTHHPLYSDPAFERCQSFDIETTGKCIRRKFVEYTFNFTQASHGTLLRCIAVDSLLGINTTTECLPLVLHPPGTELMIERLHSLLVSKSFNDVYVKAISIILDINKTSFINFYQRLDSRQIAYQIYLKFSDMICLPVNYHQLLKKI